MLVCVVSSALTAFDISVGTSCGCSAASAAGYEFAGSCDVAEASVRLSSAVSAVAS